MIGNRSAYPPYAVNTNLVMRVPFTPGKRIQFTTSRQANDPMLHYNEWEIADALSFYRLGSVPPSLTPRTLRNVGRLNERYQPWGGNPDVSATAGSLRRRAYDPVFKDPLIRCSDDWDFPIGGLLTPTALGRVHRGTPWQTLYGKAADLSPRWSYDLPDWSRWTGIPSFDEADRVWPSTDWGLLARLIRHLWPEKPNKLLSVNESKRHDWLKTLDGIEAKTNTLPDETLHSNPFTVPEYQVEPISWKSPQAERIVDAIESARLGKPAGRFEGVGDILQATALSTGSPFLNRTGVQQQRGITDEAYEAIPLQLLPRLRPDSIGQWMHTNDRPRLRFSGLEGCTYRIESSSDLIHWKLIRVEVVRNGCIDLDIAPDESEPSRFYRSVMAEEADGAGRSQN